MGRSYMPDRRGRNSRIFRGPDPVMPNHNGTAQPAAERPPAAPVKTENGEGTAAAPKTGLGPQSLSL